jgi:hypothetical protein
LADRLHLYTKRVGITRVITPAWGHRKRAGAKDFSVNLGKKLTLSLALSITLAAVCALVGMQGIGRRHAMSAASEAVEAASGASIAETNDFQSEIASQFATQATALVATRAQADSARLRRFDWLVVLGTGLLLFLMVGVRYVLTARLFTQPVAPIAERVESAPDSAALNHYVMNLPSAEPDVFHLELHPIALEASPSASVLTSQNHTTLRINLFEPTSAQNTAQNCPAPSFAEHKDTFEELCTH